MHLTKAATMRHDVSGNLNGGWTVWAVVLKCVSNVTEKLDVCNRFTGPQENALCLNGGPNAIDLREDKCWCWFF
jgi:hypothetical protein